MSKKISISIIFFIIITGCGIGGFWMNGNPSGGKNITPTRDYWDLPEGTKEERIQQWLECGGAENGSYHISPPGRSAQEIKKASEDKFDQLQLCMMKNGYNYIGSCEGEIRSTYPACIGRKK